MKKIWYIWLPAILIVTISIGLVVYAQLHTPAGHGAGPRPGQGTPGQGPRPEREHEGTEIFKLLGTLSLVLGAISYSWLRFKKKLRSPSKLISSLGKKLYAAHTYTGWAALVLVLVHGIYYLLKDFSNPHVLPGIAACLILLALAGYGLVIRRVRYKYMRKIHFLLATVWIPILFMHAGGQVVMATVATLLVWALVWVVERKLNSPSLQRG